MPELPEIEVLRRDLERDVVGRRIKDVEVRPGTNAMKVLRRHGRRKEFQDLLEGAKVEKVERIGKKLLLELDTDHVLVFDLGSTGRLLKTSTSEDVETHTHVVLGFTIGGQLRMADAKRTAEIYVTPRSELDGAKDLRDFLIDPFEQQFTWPYLSTQLGEKEVTMKELLMDQHFIVGLGDIYSDEVLFEAGLRHDRLSNKLSSQDVRRLYRALLEVLWDALKAHGTSTSSDNFTDLHGTVGTWQNELKVYGRAGEACRRCRSEIVKEEVGGRYVSYLCPQCQS